MPAAIPIHKLVAEKRGGQAFVRYRGKRWPLGPWDATLDRPSDQAERKLQRLKETWRVNPSAGLRASDDPLLLELWLKWVASSDAPSDRAGELTRCRRELFGTSDRPGPFLEMRVSEFGASELRNWRDSLCEQTRDDGSLRFGRYTVVQFVSLVCQCMEWAVTEERVEEDQARLLRLIKPPKAGKVKEPVARDAVDYERVRKVAEAMSSDAGKLLLVMWWCGARPSELYRLTVGQVRRSGAVVSEKEVRVSLTEASLWAVQYERHKTSRHGLERVVFFGPQAQEILQPMLCRDASEYLFQKSNGNPYSHKDLLNYTKRTCRRLQIAKFTPYQINHAFMARVAAAFSSAVPGSGILAAKAARGHSLRGVTQSYTGSDIVTAAKVAQQCG
jgi:integrase